jgi:hypothetical protein
MLTRPVDGQGRVYLIQYGEDKNETMRIVATLHWANAACVEDLVY